MAPPTIYLLDTNVLVCLIRAKAVGQAIDAHFGLRGGVNHCISVVTVGEMNALARKLAWGTQKVAAMQKLLGRVVWVDINHPDVLAAYGEIEGFNHAAGRTMSKNDVWIAATANATGMTPLTADGDFDHLHPAHASRIRIDPKTGNALP